MAQSMGGAMGAGGADMARLKALGGGRLPQDPGQAPGQLPGLGGAPGNPSGLPGLPGQLPGLGGFNPFKKS
jgi:signal recognition particle subunit SRP54